MHSTTSAARSPITMWRKIFAALIICAFFSACGADSGAPLPDESAPQEITGDTASNPEDAANPGSGPDSPITNTGGAQYPSKAGIHGGRIPTLVVPNKGQTDSRVRYLAQSPGRAVFFTPESVVISLMEREKTNGDAAKVSQDKFQGVALSLKFLEANKEVEIAGEEMLTARVNYLIGADKEKWHTGLQSYSGVVYKNLWPGIDAHFHLGGEMFKYEFVVQPEANLNDIRLAYEGADAVSLDKDGNIELETALGKIIDHAPSSLQTIGGKRNAVESRFVLAGPKGEYGFAVGKGYEPDFPLIIDPWLNVFEYSTFLGNTGNEWGGGVDVGASGHAYVSGTTSSAWFPTTTGAYDRSLAGSNYYDYDAFVSKFYPDASRVVYSTFIGGENFDAGWDVAVDSEGNAYVTGETEGGSSPPFPVTPGVFGAIFNGGKDAFALKLNAEGDDLIYSTFLGGGGDDKARAIKLDSSGYAHVIGDTDSTTFPVTDGAFQLSLSSSANRDAFVVKLNPEGSDIEYSTYLGGRSRASYQSGNETGRDIDVDDSGYIYVTGKTTSSAFPLIEETSFDGTEVIGWYDEEGEGFISKLDPSCHEPDPDCSGLLYSSFIGGMYDESGMGIAADSEGNAYVTGYTTSARFLTTPGAYDTSFTSPQDAFVAKINTNWTPSDTGTSLVYSTFLGGSSADTGVDIALSRSGDAYVVGHTNSPADFPVTDIHPFARGGKEIFVSRVGPDGSVLTYSTLICGESDDFPAEIALDSLERVYVAGDTMSRNFYASTGVFDSTHDELPFFATSEVFLFKLDLRCGNGTLDEGEECDDGNAAGGDGCSSVCRIDTPLDCSSDCAHGTFTLAGMPVTLVDRNCDGLLEQYGCGGSPLADIAENESVYVCGLHIINGTRGNDSPSFSSETDISTPAIFAGGPGEEYVSSGSNADDLFIGGIGNDNFNGNDGDNTICCGSGDDHCNGGVYNDTIYGGEGRDHIEGKGGDDIIFGGPGSDFINGKTGNDTIDGGADDDFVYGERGHDNLTGGDGDDICKGGSGNDVINCGSGGDYCTGGDGNDRIDCGAGEDLINGRRGTDTITSCDGSADTINGNEDSDACTVDCGADTTYSCAVACCS